MEPAITREDTNAHKTGQETHAVISVKNIIESTPALINEHSSKRLYYYERNTHNNNYYGNNNVQKKGHYGIRRHKTKNVPCGDKVIDQEIKYL